MGYNLIEISSDKLQDMSENIEKGLRYIGKAMQCVDEMQKEHESSMGERMGMRMGVKGTGPYSRYGRREYDPDMYGERMGMRYRDPYYM